MQTMATIGYGKMVPNGLLANMLVTVEAFLGFSYFAVVTGLVFANSKSNAWSKLSPLTTRRGSARVTYRRNPPPRSGSTA